MKCSILFFKFKTLAFFFLFLGTMFVLLYLYTENT